VEQLVSELTEFGRMAMTLSYSQTQPYRGPQGPPAEL
jgi:Lrp/AsnC family leucine-responsive transcriptional regulator